MSGRVGDTNVPTTSPEARGARLSSDWSHCRFRTSSSRRSPGELLHDLAKCGYLTALSDRVREFLLRVDVLPWDHDVTKTYADLRAAYEAKGVTLAPLDMMIATHAVATDATLVTRDKTFGRVPSPLRVEDWAEGD
ncbi:putative nucleic acid-binding protein [Rhodopseudomonas thermotolerans]|uniref:Nucleic acid-binding protein n=2 Tax=Rhodopseudomonas TaxID=1073 RepID=A0A336JTU2_9BRAD|nr:putative nucleic acid-binding protein [Rhodopseudomonas pentothenatexigens]REF91081.1 putative nucleic acid-binding protein [Rhodopseudomonas thermotolerans]SSW92928.1 predicted nucleic acid-binding protein [Rhodopseudomonas pentothenatexigens]